jgi:5,10-methylenetetrahydromethanopterin reductase
VPRVGIVFSGTDPIQEVYRYSKIAEERQFDIIWWGEDFFLRDGVSPIPAIALNTRQVKLGTGILSHYVHHPATIATTIATMDEISGRRMILGLGSGVPHWIREQMGLYYGKPVTAMKECIEIVRRLLGGENVNLEGEVFKCRNIRLGFEPPRKRIPIYLAAMGPKMLQLAGEVADGAIPGGAGASTVFTKRCIDQIEIGAKRVGRSISEIDIHQFVIALVSSDSNRARDSVREYLAWMVGIEGAREAAWMLEGFEENVPAIVEKVTRGDIAGAAKHVSDEMVDTLAAVGNPKEFRQRIGSYFDAGVKCLAICPIKGPEEDCMELTIEEAGKIADRR